MTNVRVWLSHDGYTDPDENLGQLVGAAQARVNALSDSRVKIGGFVFGDSTDGGQFKMLHPLGTVPNKFSDDPRYDQNYKNKWAAGNYAFYEKYGSKAVSELAPGWKQYDLLKADNGGYRSWNFDANNRSELTRASRDLADDIVEAINKGGGANPNAVVVYSAGGGANVPAEAIAYLLNRGTSAAEIQEHFAVVQHGDSNWWNNQEDEAREITRPYTIALSEQDPNSYANGMNGPGLKWMVRNDVWLDGSRFGEDFRKATAVAQGLEPFQGLKANQTLRPTKDGSDAGSHAFASDADALLAAWDERLEQGWNIPTAKNSEHLIKGNGQTKLRVMYDDFDWQDVRALMNGSSARSSAEASAEEPVAAATDSDTMLFDTPGTSPESYWDGL